MSKPSLSEFTHLAKYDLDEIAENLTPLVRYDHLTDTTYDCVLLTWKESGCGTVGNIRGPNGVEKDVNTISLFIKREDVPEHKVSEPNVPKFRWPK